MYTISQKRQRLHMLFVANHLIQAKLHVLSAYGVGRIRDLEENELDELMERLELLKQQKSQGAEYELRMWRHKCLRAMSKFMDTQDWNVVNKFMLNKKVAGKHLYELSVEEMQNLLKKINKIADIIKARETQLQNQAFNN